MNLKLSRIEYKDEGVFGVIEGSLPNGRAFAASTLEHSYGGQPKLPAGTYTCVRSMHRLHGMTEDFETFEIRGVPGHTGILFHWGNYNQDSDGCVLLGTARDEDRIVNSRAEFADFMELQKGINNFELVVTS